jgi:hypothetical protein
LEDPSLKFFVEELKKREIVISQES